MTLAEIDHMFSYHAPSEGEVAKYVEIRAAAKALANTILKLTPTCPDQTAAIRKVREAVMTANAAIALQGR